MSEEQVDEMDRGRFARPVRYGAEVHRRPRHDNTEVHRLLRHLERAGCRLTPRFLGLTGDGAERLSFVEGSTGYPPLSAEIRSDEALVSVGRAIREVHDAAAGFEWSATAAWHGYELVRPATIDCIGHHDLAPWNLVFDGTQVRGIIDWDAAGPSNRVWDLAYAAYQLVPFHPTADLAGWGWATEPDRHGRLRRLIEAYGLSLRPADVVDAAISRIHSIGAFIDREVARGDPAFAVHAREDHAAGYFRAAAALLDLRPSLV